MPQRWEDAVLDSEDDAEPVRKTWERGKTACRVLSFTQSKNPADSGSRSQGKSLFPSSLPSDEKPRTVPGSDLCSSAFREPAVL